VTEDNGRQEKGGEPGRIMPTVWLLVALVAAAVLHFLLPEPRVIPPWWNLLGVVPLSLGVAINLVADRAFHRAGTPVRPFEESTVLVTSGVFRVTRNPMYLGFVLIVLGVAVLMRSLLSFAVVPVLAVLLDRMYIAVEERMLAARFGNDWQEYRRRVRRWV